MTMLVGYIWGTRYTRVQASSVIMLTIGVVLAAMADAQSKVHHTTHLSPLENGPTNHQHAGQNLHLLIHPPRRPPHPRLRPTPLRDNGSLRANHLRSLRLPLARKSLLLTLPLPPALPPLPPLPKAPIPTTPLLAPPPALTPLKHPTPLIPHFPNLQDQHTHHPNTHRHPRPQRSHTVRLHPRREFAGGAYISAGRNDSAESEEAGEFVY